jgi:hypothetical protein
MDCITAEQMKQLIKNGAQEEHCKDHFPVVRLYTAQPQMEWLLASIDPKEPNIAYGIYDLGLGSPELGYFDLNELIQNGWVIGNDQFFKADRPISTYFAHASALAAFRKEQEGIFYPKMDEPYNGDFSHLAFIY